MLFSNGEVCLHEADGILQREKEDLSKEPGEAGSVVVGALARRVEKGKLLALWRPASGRPPGGLRERGYGHFGQAFPLAAHLAFQALRIAFCAACS